MVSLLTAGYWSYVHWVQKLNTRSITPHGTCFTSLFIQYKILNTFHGTLSFSQLITHCTVITKPALPITSCPYQWLSLPAVVAYYSAASRYTQTQVGLHQAPYSLSYLLLLRVRKLAHHYLLQIFLLYMPKLFFAGNATRLTVYGVRQCFHACRINRLPTIITDTVRSRIDFSQSVLYPSQAIPFLSL